MTREEAINVMQKYTDTESGISKVVAEAHKMAIKALEQNESAEEWYKLFVEKLDQEPKAGWIPVNERLPEDGTWNIFTDGKNISIERYKADALDHFYPSGRWFSLDEAVAWMPLPEPYKESEVEQ